MRRAAPTFLLVILAALFGATPAVAKTVCTLVADAATGALIHEQGTCDRRVTPASTFKVPIALMGYDAGILANPHAPVWQFREGYPDWVAAWKQDTDPTGWMKESVLWYSQEITRALGQERFAAYVAAFGYGNGHISGNKGKKDGLTRAWLSSSLKISPQEQVAFFRKFLARALPVSDTAYRMTAAIMTAFPLANGWTVYGKTGSGRAGEKAIGWFVGWATDGNRTVVFARQADYPRSELMRAGRSTRDDVLKDLQAILTN